MTLEEVLSRLDKKTRDKILKAKDITVEKIPLSSFTLNKGLGGGIGKGRQTLIYGNKSAGKSSMCLQTIAEAQKNGEICAWLDSEASFDKEWAERLGVDTDQLILTKTKTIDEFTLVVCELMEAGVDLIVVDSISALLPSTYFEKREELKDGLEGTKQIGTVSKELAIAVNKFNYANKNTALVLISQLRNQFSTYGASQKPMGGEAMKFFSSTMIKLWSSASEKEQLKDNFYYGDKITEQNVGRKVTFTIEYNKIGPPNQVGEYDFYYDGEFVGVDFIGEIADYAEKIGIIKKSGAWYYYDDEKFQGRKKIVSWLRENQTIVDKIISDINAIG